MVRARIGFGLFLLVASADVVCAQEGVRYMGRFIAWQVKDDGTPYSISGEPGVNIVGLGQPVRTVGHHTIEVAAPGYRPWRVEKVWLELTEECHPILRGGDHVARLVPIGSPPNSRN